MKIITIITAIAMCAGAIYGYFDFDREPAPILDRGWIMLVGAVLFGLGGFVIGVMIAIRRHEQRASSNQTGREKNLSNIPE
jgi:hypothetical protein